MNNNHEKSDVTNSKSNNQMITAAQINIDGLSKHSSIALDKFMSDHNVHIQAIQEVGSTQHASDLFPNKTFFYHFGAKGVGLAISNKLKPDIVPDLSHSGIDAIFTTVSINNESSLIASCYCRPEISTTKSLKDLLNHLGNAWAWCKSKKVKSMLVLGDFNARNAAWGDTKNNARGKLLMEFVEKNDDVMLHSAGVKTFLHSAGGSVIDLSLTFGHLSSQVSSPWTEQCYTLFSGAPQKGHIPVLQNIVSDQYVDEERKSVFDYDQANWDLWSENAKTLFIEAQAMEFHSADAMFEKFMYIVNECSDRNIPLKTVCRHSKPFWSEKLTTLSSKLQNAQKSFKFKSDPISKLNKEQCSVDFKEALVAEKNAWVHKKLEGLNTQESLQFWQRYKKMFKPKGDSFIGNLETENGLAQNDEEKENVLFDTFFTGSHLRNKAFDKNWADNMEVYLEELKENDWHINTLQNWDIDTAHVSPLASDNSVIDEPIGKKTFDNNFLNIPVSIAEVVEAIKVQEIAGRCKDMDKFHPILLKRLPIEGIKFLMEMFNCVLDTGKWIWDSSLVSFIKKADKDSYFKPGSYRPLTIASYVGKILERVLAKRLIHYCQDNKVIDSSQEGFLPNRSTSRYLYKMTASVAEARKRKMSSILLFLDFEKAFDSVSTSAMIFKLSQHGISGKFLRLIHNFLSDRYVSLRINKFIGQKRSVGKFGLPQGSVLSPLLFIIFVSDLLSDIHVLPKSNCSASVFKYADDGSVMVNSPTTSQCHEIMQIYVCKALDQWCYKWQLVVNCKKDKTEAVIIKSHDSDFTVLPNLTISGQQIQYVEHSKVLGVYIDANLSYEKHAKYVLQSCWYKWHHLSDQTTRKKGLNCSSLTLLFKTCVLTKLLYASPIWLRENLGMFDDFIYKALFRISGSQFNPPAQLLHVIFGIPPLEITLEVMTTKFLLKGLIQDDEVRALVLQLEERPHHHFYPQITALKRFLIFQDSAMAQTGRLRVHQISLLDREVKSLVYSQDCVANYLCHQWDTKLFNNTDSLGKIPDHICAQNVIDLVKTNLVMKNSLFPRSSHRSEDTDMIDFLHGQGLRFSDFRSKFDKSCSSSCIDCSSHSDNPYHKLFRCEKFEGPERVELLSSLKDYNKELFKYVFIFAADASKRQLLRELVKIICKNSNGDDYYKAKTPS